MAKTLQNFYKSTITIDWTIGTGNFYISQKPTVSNGWLVVSPNNSAIKEIVAYTATGTDANGDYITISQRGVGGTTEQTHTIGEPVRMNITAEYWADMQADIDSIVAAGAANANTTTRGIAEEATASEIDAGTQAGSTGAELFVNPKYLKDSHNVPTVVPGPSGNALVSNGTDWTSSTISVGFPIQDLPIILGTSTARKMFVTSNTTGTVLFAAYDLSSTTATIVRIVRDSATLLYYITHSTTLTVDSSSLKGIAIAGNFLYVTAVIGTVQSLRRYAIADLSGVTTMTGLTDAQPMFGDGTNLYVFNGTNAWKKYTISGTAVTDLGATTFTSSGTAPTSQISDGNFAYISDSNGVGTYNIRKYALTGGAVVSTTSYTFNIDAWNASGDPALFIASTGILGFAFKHKKTNDTAVLSTMEHIMAITQP